MLECIVDVHSTLSQASNAQVTSFLLQWDEMARFSEEDGPTTPKKLAQMLEEDPSLLRGVVKYAAQIGMDWELDAQSFTGAGLPTIYADVPTLVESLIPRSQENLALRVIETRKAARVLFAIDKTCAKAAWVAKELSILEVQVRMNDFSMTNMESVLNAHTEAIRTEMRAREFVCTMDEARAALARVGINLT
jgi:hypothetical protein